MISGFDTGKIFYQKTIANSNGELIKCLLVYKESEKLVYDEVSKKIFETFK